VIFTKRVPYTIKYTPSFRRLLLASVCQLDNIQLMNIKAPETAKYVLFMYFTSSSPSTPATSCVSQPLTATTSDTVRTNRVHTVKHSTELGPPATSFQAAQSGSFVPEPHFHLPLEAPSLPYEFSPFELWPDDGQCLRLTNSQSLLDPLSNLQFFSTLFSLGGNLIVACARSRVGRPVGLVASVLHHSLVVTRRRKGDPSFTFWRQPRGRELAATRCGTPQR
jgi:hypothetical protein